MLMNWKKRKFINIKEDWKKKSSIMKLENFLSSKILLKKNQCQNVSMFPGLKNKNINQNYCRSFLLNHIHKFDPKENSLI